MQDYKLKVWVGETIPLEIEYDTDIDGTAELNVYDDTEVVLTKTANFVENVAVLDITAAECTTLGAGVFKYLVTVTYSGGDVDIIPESGDLNGCENGTCTAPELEICGVPA